MSSREPLFQEYDPIPGSETGAVWRYSLAHRKPLHFHGHLEFLLVLRGHAVERIGNRMYTTHAGQMVWHLPSIPHELVFASRDLDLRIVHAEPDLAGSVARELCARAPIEGRASRGEERSIAIGGAFSGWVRELGWLAAGHPVVELRRADLDRLLEDCHATFAEAGGRDDAAPRLRRLLTTAWLASIDHGGSAQPASLTDLASCLLLERPELDRPALCRLLDVSEGYLSRCFRKELGATLLAHRGRVRVARFVAHVEREGQTLLDAAMSAGFGSYSQLHRTFCEIVGMSPSAYLWRGGRGPRARLTRSSA